MEMFKVETDLVADEKRKNEKYVQMKIEVGESQ